MVNDNDPDSSRLEMANMADTIATLTETVGTIQTDLTKVSSSVDSHVSDIKKMFETMMGKTKVSEEVPVASNDASSGDEYFLHIAEMEANIAKARAKAKKRQVSENFQGHQVFIG